MGGIEAGFSKLVVISVYSSLCAAVSKDSSHLLIKGHV